MKYAKIAVLVLACIVFYEILQVTVNLLIIGDSISLESEELPSDIKEKLMTNDKEELADITVALLKSMKEDINADVTVWKNHIYSYKKLTILSAISFFLTLVALTLNKPLLRIRKKPLAEE